MLVCNNKANAAQITNVDGTLIMIVPLTKTDQLLSQMQRWNTQWTGKVVRLHQNTGRQITHAADRLAQHELPRLLEHGTLSTNWPTSDLVMKYACCLLVSWTLPTAITHVVQPNLCINWANYILGRMRRRLHCVTGNDRDMVWLFIRFVIGLIGRVLTTIKVYWCPG